MPRPMRIRGNDLHYHIILRCNNKERLLKEKNDFEIFLAILADVQREYDFRLYNYELLNAHVHLLLSTHENYFIDQIMHDLCFKYAQNYNRRYKRNGHFWAQRYRSRLVLNDLHGLACLRYQHRNAFSAGIVSRPEDWPWSGYTHYSFNTPNALLEYHPSFLSLAEDVWARQKFYREFVHTSIPSDKETALFEGRGRDMSRRFLKVVRQTDELLRLIKSQEP